MITLENTQANAVAAAINDERRRMGSPTVGMVLTLLILTDEMHQAEALAAASIAAREHPMRVIALIERPGRDTAHLDAQIQVGGDEGPGEIIACRLHGELAKHAGSVAIPLLLPDTPVVAWWPGDAPDKPAEDPIGMHAQRRITDTNTNATYIQELGIRLANYEPGDTDLAWTRTTPWRSMLAAALDQPVGRVQEVTVHSEPRSASSLLLAGWLRKRLHVPTKIVHDKGPGITKVVLKTTQGEVSLSRPDGRVAQLAIPHAPESPVALPRRNMAELLAEELRRLDPDEIYYQALKGIESVLHPPVKEAKSKVKSGTSSTKYKKSAAASKAKSATSAAKPKSPSAKPKSSSAKPKSPSAKPKSSSAKPKSTRAASKPTAANSKKKSK